MEHAHISELSPEMQKVALGNFAKLAEEQRGTPELMGGGGPGSINPAKTHASGLWHHATEHIGDLTHRMSQPNCERWSYGYEWVEQKVRVQLRTLRNPYGYGKEVMENLRANHVYYKSEKPFEQWVKEWEEAGDNYARAHRALTVWNAAQFHAREAAVAIGERNYEKTIKHLTEIERRLDTVPNWEMYAGTCCLNASGQIVMFSRGVQEAAYMDRLIKSVL